MTGSVTDALRRQYLLGTLAPEESAAFEETYFSNDSEFEQLLAAEDDLIDEYARGSLSPDERQRVELALRLQSHQAKRVMFARALSETPQGPERRKVLFLPRSGWTVRPMGRAVAVFAAMAAVLIAVVGISSWYQRAQLERHLAAMEAELAMLRRSQEETRGDLNRLQNRTDALAGVVERQREPKGDQSTESLSGVRIASLTLRRMLRGEPNANVLVIRPGTERVQLKAGVDVPYQAMRAALTKLDGKELWRSGTVRSERVGSSSIIAVEIPAQLLRGREYLLRLLGTNRTGGDLEDAGEYYFQVVYQ